LGPNGAGKTTTIEILEGLTAPDSGEVRILGMEWRTDAPRLRARLGVQLQETELPDKLRVEEILRLFRSFYPTGRSVEALLEVAQLGEKRHAQVRTLSGGQRQRLSVACALAGDPEILFLDEPTTGLDPQSRRQLWDVAVAFRAAGGTILLTTHFMDEAERLADRVAILDHGEILVQGSPRELIRSLGGEHVVEFASTAMTPREMLFSLPGVSEVRSQSESWLLTAQEPHLAVPALLALVAGQGGELTALNTHHATLDDVFLARTGRALRDE
jgi:ABC-2 type transport system ATP-binding protein